jgi:AcrR family transcriptional regulator
MHFASTEKNMNRGTRPYHHGNLRSAVVEAAVRIWTETGLHDVTFQALGRATGVTHTAVQRQFPNKDAVIAAVAEKGAELLSEEMKRAIATCPPNPRSAFLHIGRTPIEFAVRHPIYFRAMFLQSKQWNLQGLANAESTSPFRLMHDLVRHWQKERFLKKGSTFSLAVAILATTQGLATLAEANRLPSNPILRRRMVDRVHLYLLAGIAHESD